MLFTVLGYYKQNIKTEEEKNHSTITSLPLLTNF